MLRKELYRSVYEEKCGECFMFPHDPSTLCFGYSYPPLQSTLQVLWQQRNRTKVAEAWNAWILHRAASCSVPPMFGGLDSINWSGLMLTSLQEKVHVLLICIPTAAAMTPVCCRPMGGQKAVYLACKLRSPELLPLCPFPDPRC